MWEEGRVFQADGTVYTEAQRSEKSGRFEKLQVNQAYQHKTAGVRKRGEWR